MESWHWAKLSRSTRHLPTMRSPKNYSIRRGKDVWWVVIETVQLISLLEYHHLMDKLSNFLLNQNPIDHINRKFPHQSEWVKLIKLLPWCSYSQLDYTPTIINIIDNLLLHGWKNISLLENRIAQLFLCVSRDLNYIIKAALNRRPLGHVSLSLCFSSKFDLIRVY